MIQKNWRNFDDIDSDLLAKLNSLADKTAGSFQRYDSGRITTWGEHSVFHAVAFLLYSREKHWQPADREEWIEASGLHKGNVR